MKALLSGTLLAFGCSLFFGYPLIPVLFCIGLVAKIAKSPGWRWGGLYGAVVGVAGFFLRITSQANPALPPADLVLALMSAAVIFGLIGIGINRLVASGDTIMW